MISKKLIDMFVGHIDILFPGFLLCFLASFDPPDVEDFVGSCRGFPLPTWSRRSPSIKWRPMQGAQNLQRKSALVARLGQKPPNWYSTVILIIFNVFFSGWKQPPYGVLYTLRSFLGVHRGTWGILLIHCYQNGSILRKVMDSSPRWKLKKGPRTRPSSSWESRLLLPGDWVEDFLRRIVYILLLVKLWEKLALLREALRLFYMLSLLLQNMTCKY